MIAGRLPFLFFFLLFFQIASPVKAFIKSDPHFLNADSSSSKVIISEIKVIGNKTTHPRIIRRELIFSKGDTVTPELLQAMITRSRENLLNTQLFNFVNINIVQDGNDKVEIIILLTERWYIFPIPIFEVIDRNFNEWWKTRSISRTVYGLQVKWENFRGRNESLRISLRFGYTENISVYYNIPYVNQAQTVGLTFYTGYSRNHEVGYSLTDNHINFYKNTAQYIKHDYLGGVRLNIRSAIHNTNTIFAEYKQNVVTDTVIELNSEYFQPGCRRQQLINIGFQFRQDYRDFVEYPLKGYYYDFEAVKQGIGAFKNEMSQLYIDASFKKYFELSHRWHFATGGKGKITGQNFLPFAYTRALGYNADFVRGYEYYVINGQNYILLKSNLKYSILPLKIFHADYIPSEKFSIIPFSIYLNGYCDAGYVRDRQFAAQNPLANTWLIGYGAGIDFVTYYNIILRVEYSINKMGEKALFIHFAAPI
jgi:outer membrane protein assembly factor BamA